jgi:hypothetical protein
MHLKVVLLLSNKANTSKVTVTPRQSKVTLVYHSLMMALQTLASNTKMQMQQAVVFSVQTLLLMMLQVYQA